MIDRLTVNRK